MKKSKKEILNNFEKYKGRSIEIGCIVLVAEDLLNPKINKSFDGNDLFIIERKIEDLELSKDELKTFNELKTIFAKLKDEDKKILINMLLGK